MKLSEHFSLEELCASSTAKSLKITNVPSIEEQENLRALCVNVLEKLRQWWGKPIVVSSGYRCKKLNQAVGGVSNSQHMKGEAADLFLNGDKSVGDKWFYYIKTHLDFDQLIMEHNSKGTYWVHVSFRRSGNRKQVISNLTKK